MAYAKLGPRFRWRHCRDIGVNAEYGILEFRFKEDGFRTVGTFNLSWLPLMKANAKDLRSWLKENADAIKWASR